jgi:hypothetical protein
MGEWVQEELGGRRILSAAVPSWPTPPGRGNVVDGVHTTGGPVVYLGQKRSSTPYDGT